MASKLSSTSCSFVSPYGSSLLGTRRISQMNLKQRPFDGQQCDAQQIRNAKVKLCNICGEVKVRGTVTKRGKVVFASSEDRSQFVELQPDVSLDERHHANATANPPSSGSLIQVERTDGKPGLISFYNRPYGRNIEIISSDTQRGQSSLLWFIAPSVLVASFIFPSLYLRKILSTVFEDSLLTDFLILFFTEALFYSGVAIFLLLLDRVRRPIQPAADDNKTLAPQLAQRISSVAVLVLSLIIPMVTMGLVWPWTGPAASATLAPYLVGIVIQFAFEQYARYWKSPSSPVIPVIFQVYRLHQLNRATQLVTALSFTVRGAEMTSHNMAINSSLGTLLNVLQFLGVVCIWSLSSLFMRFFPSSLVDA
ncbi:hypothetical protein HS088_TW18G00853 [Tripterygium wilfordii]|uniref:Uncharacterized protein n=1 Tax=Tripterygium wilfordii TaxID=458696 RepID=A0A7J7CDG1_TRIWF|nr:uncharacterized protein LOC119984094 isoform X2 [Tripterygium wilfordii]KAF5732163.1 hypothetical protein HS088_TW18G00853 [Tripterygium wilfordii]